MMMPNDEPYIPEAVVEKYIYIYRRYGNLLKYHVNKANVSSSISLTAPNSL